MRAASAVAVKRLYVPSRRVLVGILEVLILHVVVADGGPAGGGELECLS
jgi:hypothetical protein